MAAGLVSAQSFSHFNPPPCDFSDQFYMDNGVDSSRTPAQNHTGELNTEPDGRFGDFRQTGPPATGSQQNWVPDTNCAPNDPTRRNFRILATTGAYKDSDGQPSEFFSIIAFAHASNGVPPTFNGASETPPPPGTLGFFKANSDTGLPYSRTVGAIGPNGGLDNQQTNPGNTISLTQGTDQVGNTPEGLNPRGISQQEIVSNFEAYGAPAQKLTSGPFAGTLAPTPCGPTLFDVDMVGIAPGDCFPVKDGKNPDGSTLSNIATPNTRQDWRVASNRNAIDGSDNNCITNNDQHCKHKGTFSDSPFGYFCDDLLGMWIVTYFWYTQNAVGGTKAAGGTFTPTANCQKVLSCIAKIFGTTTDGTPVIKTGGQLHFIEGVPGTLASEFAQPVNANNANGVPPSCMTDADLPPASAPCAHEGNLNPNGADGGAVWLVCPVIPDPRNGAIATDAFLDAKRFPNGSFVDDQVPSTPIPSPGPPIQPLVGGTLSQNFTCLQQTGKFCSESAPGK